MSPSNVIVLCSGRCGLNNRSCLRISFGFNRIKLLLIPILFIKLGMALALLALLVRYFVISKALTVMQSITHTNGQVPADSDQCPM